MTGKQLLQDGPKKETMALIREGFFFGINWTGFFSLALIGEGFHRPVKTISN